MAAFTTFSRNTRDLPIPSTMLDSLLEEIKDVAELKCTLRFFWMLSQQKGQPRMVKSNTMVSDQVLLSALGSSVEIQRGLDLAVSRGTLLEMFTRTEKAYLLHTPDNENLVKQQDNITRKADPSPDLMPRAVKPNIFRLYEENIGMITPLLSDELRETEEIYPAEWVLAAFKEAVDRNKRNWKYIIRILERWSSEGRSVHGESGSDTQAVTAAEYVRRYGLRR